jgi:predicted MFS family arabinose efflux permease
MGGANIVGSLAAGICLRHVPTQVFLIAVFAIRALSIALLLVLPVSAASMMGFAVLMGLSYMALLPAISQQVAERFGVQRLATVFGLVALVHQLGSFAGAWLGGVVAQATGSDTLMWAIDIGLALIAITLQWQAGRDTGRLPERTLTKVFARATAFALRQARSPGRIATDARPG